MRMEPDIADATAPGKALSMPNIAPHIIRRKPDGSTKFSNAFIFEFSRECPEQVPGLSFIVLEIKIERVR
jgi:hypothetical protein